MYRSAESVYKGGWPTYANQGDIDLGNDAYALGVEVKKNPELLKTIGSTIRSRFCL